jgi:hypothetical protein
VKPSRFPVATGLLFAVLASITVPVLAQRQALPRQAPHAAFNPRDLQGTWNNTTPIPFQRSRENAAKEFFTEEEAREFAKQAVQ